VKVDLTFPEITRTIQDLTLPSFDLVAGIGRGGIVPASLLAYKLGCDLIVLPINYRDDANQPQRDAPALLALPTLPDGPRRILLVDDVSVSGKTLEAARRVLNGYDVTTLVMKGRADYVLFPDIASCVNWPWKPRS
jgi:hypoxanthine phosphoribosyltransferase